MNAFGIPFLSELMSQMRDLLYVILAKTEFLGTPDHVLGITACAVSVALFVLYPIPTQLRILRDKSTRDRQPYPHCFTQFACFLWLFYGLNLYPAFQNLCIVLVHLPCTLVQICYMYNFQKHTTHRNKKIMEATVILPEMALFMYYTYSRIPFPDNTQPHLTGFISAVFGIIMYASPIASIIDAWKTRNTNHLPFGLCTVYFLYAVAWFAYAYLHSPTYDVYLAIAHGGGVILEILMLLVSCIVMVILLCSGTAAKDSSLDLMAPEDSTIDLEALLVHD